MASALRWRMLTLLGEEVGPAFARHWHETLTTLSEDLDLADPEDRALFRGRVRSQTGWMRNTALRELAKAFGTRLQEDDRRESLSGSLADAWATRNSGL